MGTLKSSAMVKTPHQNLLVDSVRLPHKPTPTAFNTSLAIKGVSFIHSASSSSSWRNGQMLPTVCCCDAPTLTSSLVVFTAWSHQRSLSVRSTTFYSLTIYKKNTCQAVLAPSRQIPQSVLGLLPLQCSHLLSPRAMTWLHGRARTLAENVLTLSARGGRWGWLPPWASQDPKGRVRGRELQPEGPSHPAGTWPTSLPFCCPDQNCCPPPPIAWWLKGKKSVCKGSSPCLSWGPCFTSCSKENQENGQQNERLSQTRMH